MNPLITFIGPLQCVCKRVGGNPLRKWTDTNESGRNLVSLIRSVSLKWISSVWSNSLAEAWNKISWIERVECQIFVFISWMPNPISCVYVLNELKKVLLRSNVRTIIIFDGCNSPFFLNYFSLFFSFNLFYESWHPVQIAKIVMNTDRKLKAK